MLVNDPTKTRRQIIVMAVVLGILQIAIVPNIGLGLGRANLCLVFVGCMCLGGDAQKAPILGFCAGLFYDLSTSGPIGLMALLLTLVGWLFSLISQTKVSDDLGPSIALFAPVAGIVNLIYAFALLFCNQLDGFVAAVFFHALPAFILDVLCFVIVGFLMGRSAGSSSGAGFGGARHGRGGYSMKRGL